MLDNWKGIVMGDFSKQDILHFQRALGTPILSENESNLVQKKYIGTHTYGEKVKWNFWLNQDFETGPICSLPLNIKCTSSAYMWYWSLITNYLMTQRSLKTFHENISSGRWKVNRNSRLISGYSIGYLWVQAHVKHPSSNNTYQLAIYCQLKWSYNRSNFPFTLYYYVFPHGGQKGIVQIMCVIIMKKTFIISVHL